MLQEWPATVSRTGPVRRWGRPVRRPLLRHPASDEGFTVVESVVALGSSSWCCSACCAPWSPPPRASSPPATQRRRRPRQPGAGDGPSHRYSLVGLKRDAISPSPPTPTSVSGAVRRSAPRLRVALHLLAVASAHHHAAQQQHDLLRPRSTSRPPPLRPGAAILTSGSRPSSTGAARAGPVRVDGHRARSRSDLRLQRPAAGRPPARGPDHRQRGFPLRQRRDRPLRLSTPRSPFPGPTPSRQLTVHPVGRRAGPELQRRHDRRPDAERLGYNGVASGPDTPRCPPSRCRPRPTTTPAPARPTTSEASSSDAGRLHRARTNTVDLVKGASSSLYAKSTARSTSRALGDDDPLPYSTTDADGSCQLHDAVCRRRP